jgi:RNA-directed DNA polymerase
MKQSNKPFYISKHSIYQAFLKVKANKGAPGVDELDLKDFEKNLKGNLYKLWNRMSSGSYFPPPVKRVYIPKKDGGKRPLGIPTVGDRIAQMVVRDHLEPFVEKIFHKDSYGYRPGKSAQQAVEVTKVRCIKKDWVVDMDIKGFFDAINHELMMKAVKHVTDCRWVHLYVERWLKAPLEEDGRVQSRLKGTPQGGVISPILANLYLHFTFDEWMRRRFPTIEFARYADDIVVHCVTERQSQMILRVVKNRFMQCDLELHSEKTRMVYCQDGRRRQSHENKQFDFLGFTFRQRTCKSKEGNLYQGFRPAISNKAKQAVRDKVKEWRLNSLHHRNLVSLANKVNPQIRGWLNYYGNQRKWELKGTCLYMETKIVKWASKKYKRFKGSPKKAWEWLRRVSRRDPLLLSHWSMLYGTSRA